MAERLCVFDDKVTGKNPFRPQREKKRTSCGRKIIKLFILPFLISKAILAAVLFAIVAITDTIVSLIPVRLARRVLQRTVEKFLLRSLLLCLGFWWTKTSTAPKRIRIRHSKKHKSVFGTNLSQSNALILCNYSSFVEILCLAYWCSPIFVFPVPNAGDGQDKVVTFGLVGAVAQACSSPSARPAKKSVTLESVLKHNAGPIVLLAEGSRTNGTCVLPLSTCLDEVLANQHKALHIVATKYAFTFFSPANPVLTFIQMFKQLLIQFNHSMEALHLSDVQISTVDNVDRTQLQQWLGALLGQEVQCIHDLDFRSYDAFMDLYNGTGDSRSGKFNMKNME